MKHAAGTRALSYRRSRRILATCRERVWYRQPPAEKKPRKDLNRRTEHTQKSPWPQAIDAQIDARAALVSSMSSGEIIITSQENGSRSEN